MFFLEKLKRALSKVADLANNSVKMFVVPIAYLSQHFRIRVTKRMEDIVLFLGILILSEDKIDPKMKMFTYIVTFQGCSEGQHKLFCIFCPRRQFNITNIFSTLLLSKLNMRNISKESWHVVKFWDAFFDIRCIGLVHQTFPYLV